MAKEQAADANSINIIGVGTTIEGEIISNGDVRIDGNLKGNLTTKGKLIIGQTGTIQGDVKCKSSDVSGNILGQIIVNELLSLKASSKIKGDIITNKLSIEPGATFTGTCKMNGENAQTSTGTNRQQHQPQNNSNNEKGQKK